MEITDRAYWLTPQSRIYFSPSDTAPCIIVRDADRQAAYLHLNNGELVGDQGRADALTVLDALASAIVAAAKALGVQPEPAAPDDDDDDDEPAGIAAHEAVATDPDTTCARCGDTYRAHGSGDTAPAWCIECACWRFVVPAGPIVVHEPWAANRSIMAQIMADPGFDAEREAFASSDAGRHAFYQAHPMAENELRAAHGDR